MRKSCIGCGHYRYLGAKTRYMYGCHYLIDTGQPRGCPADKCDKYTTKKFKDPDCWTAGQKGKTK